MRQVAVTDWVAELADCRADGYDSLDMIAGVDRVESIEVIASVIRSSDAGCMLLSTRLGADRTIATIAPLYAGAGWYERELAEMFGVRISDAADERPLLRRTDEGAPTLLKGTVLGARVLTPLLGSGATATRSRVPARPCAMLSTA